MAKFKKEKVHVRDREDHNNYMTVDFDANVDSEGEFYMKFNEAEIAKFTEAGISLEKSSKRENGYLRAPTYKELVEKVESKCRDLISRKLDEETIVLLYAIETCCNYALKDGEILPNWGSEWTKERNDDIARTHARNGTFELNSQQTRPYGISIYVKAVIKRIYKYRDGKKKIEYDYLSGNSLHERDKAFNEIYQNSYYLKWINNLACIDRPKDTKSKELPYTENTAGLFVNMIKSICMMNERIKDFLEPETLLKIAEAQQNIFALPEINSEKALNSKHQ